jgi:hypothetical protein
MEGKGKVQARENASLPGAQRPARSYRGTNPIALVVALVGCVLLKQGLSYSVVPCYSSLAIERAHNRAIQAPTRCVNGTIFGEARNTKSRALPPRNAQLSRYFSSCSLRHSHPHLGLFRSFSPNRQHVSYTYRNQGNFESEWLPASYARRKFLTSDLLIFYQI